MHTGHWHSIAICDDSLRTIHPSNTTQQVSSLKRKNPNPKPFLLSASKFRLRHKGHDSEMATQCSSKEPGVPHLGQALASRQGFATMRTYDGIASSLERKREREREREIYIYMYNPRLENQMVKENVD